MSGHNLLAVAAGVLLFALGCSAEAPTESEGPGSMDQARMRANASWRAVPLPDAVPTGCPTSQSSAFDINSLGNIAGVILSQCPNSYATDAPYMWFGPTHRVVALAVPPVYTAVDAWAINNKNQIAGNEYDYSYASVGAIFWANPQTYYEWHAYRVHAWDVDDAGNVVGAYQAYAGGDQIAFVWTPSTGAFSSLSSLGGTHSDATAVTASGTVVGWSTDASGIQHAVYWSGTTPVDLGLLPGGHYSAVVGVSDNFKYIVGYADSAYNYFGTGFSPGQLPTLLGGTWLSDANDRNQVIGTGPSGAFLRNGSSGTVLLPGLPNSYYATPWGINSRTQIVGQSIQQPSYYPHAVYWDPSSGG